MANPPVPRVRRRELSSQNKLADQVTIRENKLSLVERLADDLAHEIKNPLHSMVINLEVLRRRLARLSDAGEGDLLRYTGVISSELERVNRRVDLLLRMVRPQRDSDDPTTLGEVLEELRELVELECERHNVGYRLDQPNFILRARLPRASTRQMILSLILNTLDSIPAGGTLVVTTELHDDAVRIHFTGFPPEGGSMSPPGMSDENYLPVARALAERLGGSLQVDTPSPTAAGSGGYVLCIPRDAPEGPDAGTSGAADG